VEWNDPAYNFRDLGGLPTEDGRTTRRGVVYRSATLHDCGADEAAVLRDRLAIGCVVDLRTPDEIADQGAASATAWGVRCVNLPVLPPPLPPAGPADLLTRYLAYLEHSTPNVVAALALLGREAPRPVAIHCTSGKDRTGVVTGLLLRLVGVTRDAVAEDYAATAPNIGAVMERLGRRGPRPLRTAAIPPGILEAETETMRAFLEKFEARHGTVRAWAVENGLEPDAVAVLEGALLDGEPPGA
jgi:hypothetical protein